MLRKATHRNGGRFGRPIKEGEPGFQRDPKAAPPHPTYSILRSDIHLEAVEAAARRLGSLGIGCADVELVGESRAVHYLAGTTHAKLIPFPGVC